MGLSHAEMRSRGGWVGGGFLSHAEAKCARSAGVGVPERSEPEGPQEAEYAEECFWKMWGQTLSLYLIINHFSIKIEQIGCYCVNEN